jgi:uncharacterized protein
MKIENNQPRESTGVIYSFSIVYVGFGHMADRAPYVLCQVEVNKDEIVLGVCLDKESLDCIQIGLPVKLQFQQELGYQIYI